MAYSNPDDKRKWRVRYRLAHKDRHAEWARKFNEAEKERTRPEREARQAARDEKRKAKAEKKAAKAANRIQRKTCHQCGCEYDTEIVGSVYCGKKCRKRAGYAKARERKLKAHKEEIAERQRKEDARELAHDLRVILPSVIRAMRIRIQNETGMVICRKCGKVGARYSMTCLCHECGSKHTTERYRQMPIERRRKQFNAQRAKRTPERIVAESIATRTRLSIKRAALGKPPREERLTYLGCTVEQAAKYIEAQFNSRMTWENYGKAWHIDHVVPVDSYDLSKEEDRAHCFHYSNLRPMWARANIRKGNAKLAKPYQPMLLIGL
jgi:hypothetical protein